MIQNRNALRCARCLPYL